MKDGCNKEVEKEVDKEVEVEVEEKVVAVEEVVAVSKIPYSFLSFSLFFLSFSKVCACICIATCFCFFVFASLCHLSIASFNLMCFLSFDCQKEERKKRLDFIN